jgi:Fe-S-cluster containining protein
MSLDHDAILRDWEQHAEADDERTFRFLRGLKLVSDPERLDTLARERHEEAFGLIDCTRCANCCKTMEAGVTAEDAERIAQHLGVSRETFVAKYLKRDELNEEDVIKSLPCPFLGADDRCTIYQVRPQSCREYPHTNKEGFTTRTYLHTENARNCPAVYYIVQQLRRRGRR